MLKQLLFSAALATVAISAQAESKVLWQSEDPAGKLVGWGDPALTLTAEEAASIKAGDFLTMTVEGVDPENGWPQVALFQGNVGWPPAVNEGVGNKEYPYVASFGVTPEFADSIHAYGIVFKGDGAYVSAVGLKESTINVGPNTVWFGPKKCDYGNSISIAKSIFSTVAPDDKIVVEYDKEVAEHTLQFIFGGWSGPNIATYQAWKAPFLKIDEENGTMTITLDSSLSDLTWGEEGEEKQYDLFTLLKEGGLIMQGPCTVNQILYIPAPLEFPEEMSFTLNGETELEGVTVSQEFSDGTIDIYVNGEYAADEITMEFATPQGWDSMVVQVLGGGDFEYAKKAPVENDEYSWVSLEQAEAYGSKPGNTFTFPVDGEYYYGIINLVKDNQVYWATIGVNFEVSKAEGAEPTFPNTVEYTINGEKELAGVDVVIKEDEVYGPTMTLTGESDAETISVTLALPSGWDGWVVSSSNEVSEQPIAQTRGEYDWYPLDYLINYMGYQKGNTVTFTVGEEDQWASFGLYKDGNVYQLKNVTIEFEVVSAGGSTDPVFPESLAIDTRINGEFTTEGLEVSQTNEDGQIFISVTGEIEEEKFDVILDVPEGWTGFISMPVETKDVEIGEYNVGGKMSKVQEADWQPVEDKLETEGAAKGNKFTFKANGTRQQVEVHLYKDGMVDVANFITLTANVTGPGNKLADANQAAYEKVVAEINAVKAEYEKAVSDIETQYPEYDMSEMKGIIEDAISQAETGAEQALETANEDGEEFFFPFSAEDIEIMIEVMKENAKTTGVNGINAADKAAYYDLQGNKISTPKAGMYVKVVDGKATKVIVK